MKNTIGRLALVGSAALILTSGVAFSADATTDQSTAPGTAAQTDTKTQENIPAGTTAQKTASMPSGTKKKHHKPVGTQPVADQQGITTSKSPQVSTTPAQTQP
jgi:hypothetical protein